MRLAQTADGRGEGVAAGKAGEGVPMILFEPFQREDGGVAPGADVLFADLRFGREEELRDRMDAAGLAAL